jgi:hypothetical protein
MSSVYGLKSLATGCPIMATPSIIEKGAHHPRQRTPVRAGARRKRQRLPELHNMRELFSEYGVKARLFSALLCVPPFLLLKHFAVDPFVDPSLTTLWVSVAGDVSLAAVLMYLLTQVNRFVSKACLSQLCS